MEKDTWKTAISEALDQNGEKWSDVLAYTLTHEELNREFDSGYGRPNGPPFTLWTANRVYFPIMYDGSEWVGSAPRNPCDEAMRHQGG